MALQDQYLAAHALSPRAARLATRMLDKLIDVPFAWRLSLRMALAERTRRSAADFTASDFTTIEQAAQDQAQLAAALEAAPDTEQRQALEFAREVRADARARQGERD